MVSDPYSKFIICLPVEPNLLELVESWTRELNIEELPPTPIEKLLEDETAPLFVFIGDQFLNDLIYEPRFCSLLKEKVIYHLGGIDGLKIPNPDSIGMRAYFGYKSSPAFLTTAKEGREFRDAFFSGLMSLSRQETLGTTKKDTRKAWRELYNIRTNSEHDLFRRMFAFSNLDNLLFIGDETWSAPSPTRLVSVRPSVIHTDRPRIEVINLSPILLKWLQEDPARLAKLSPEQFEDLIAERLTRAGLIVTKTGKTNTPDGGIDLIAYPKSSSIPYLLAAQIKHSHNNRPIPAPVVRDFRGAITSLPIDMGLLVTNTRFTEDAQWAARQLPKLIRLRSMEDLKLWLANEIDESSILKDFPSSIEIAPGLVIPIPWSIK